MTVDSSQNNNQGGPRQPTSGGDQTTNKSQCDPKSPPQGLIGQAGVKAVQIINRSGSSADGTQTRGTNN